MDRIEVKKEYELYLESEEFDKIRQAVFKRDGCKCVVCGGTEKIVPHHLHYNNVYNEHIEDLITLCSRCHAIYHAIDNRRKLALKIYVAQNKEEREEQNRAYEEEQKRAREEAITAYERKQREEEELKKQIVIAVKAYLSKDYCKNGDLDMCSWQVLNPIIDHECDAHNASDVYINRLSIMNWFLYRRCEFFKRCLDQNISLIQMQNSSKFPSDYLRKWYKKSRVEAKLKEEETLLALQINKEEEEDNNHAET